MDELTERQQEIFNYIVEYFWNNHQIPSFLKITEHFGFYSTNSAQEHVHNLVEKGYLEKNENGKYKFTNLDLIV